MSAPGTGPQDVAAPLDTLLADAALGPLRRLLPVPSGLRFLADRTARPGETGARARELLVELGRIAAGRSDLAPGAKDRRFADPAWSGNPALCRALQAYLAATGAAQQVLDDAELDWRDRERLTLALDNLTAALAPSNNPLLNPLGWKAALDTGGRSVLSGLGNLARDLRAAPRVPTMVRPDAFEVGRDLAATPGSVVLRTEVLELIRYTPTTASVRRRPLLVVPPVINKYYVADLAPNRSLVEYLVDGGQQVFMISWRNPDRRHRDWDLDTYGREILQALDAVRRITGADKALTLGFCSGGTILSMVLGVLAAEGRLEDEIAGSGLAVCVLDQERAGTAGALLSPRTARAAAAVSRARGYLDGRSLAELFAWLRPNDLVWNYWVNNYLQGRDPAAFDLLYWNADTTRMAAGLHRDLLDLGVRNALVDPGAATMLGRPVDLGEVKTDAYVVAGVADHICPWQNCYSSARLFGGRTRFVLSSSGHIASMVNPPGNPKARYQVSDDLPADPAEFAVGTASTSGTWWPDYLAWLGERSGPDVPPPAQPAEGEFAPLCPAPGTYVRQR